MPQLEMDIQICEYQQLANGIISLPLYNWRTRTGS